MSFFCNDSLVRRWLIVAVLCSPILTSCAKADKSRAAVKSVPVPIRGVNYTAEPFSFVVMEPVSRDNHGGGETINSFGAGGTVCCFELPVKWHAGLKVLIVETYWLPMKEDQSLPEVKRNHVVEVPPYLDGKVGDLWVLRGADGTLDVVSSEVQPDHPRWPGKVKGYPVPSVEYQRQIYDRDIAEVQAAIDMYTRSLDEFEKNPAQRASKDWNLSRSLEPNVLKPFRGYDDPAYIAMLKESYAEGLAEAREELRNKKARRP